MKTILRTNAMPISTAFGDSRSASSEEQTPWSAPNYSFNGWSDHHASFSNNNIDYWEKEDKRQFDELTDKIDFKF